MPYKEDGSYQYDPTDFQDQADLQQFLQEDQKQATLKNIANQLQTGQEFSQGVGQTWKAALTEVDVSEEDYNQLFQEDQEAVRRAIAQGMRTAAREIAERAKAKKEPAQPQRRGRQVLQGEHGKFVSPKTEEGKRAAARQAQEMRDLEYYREKSRKRGLDSQDELDLIGSLFPDPL